MFVKFLLYFLNTILLYRQLSCEFNRYRYKVVIEMLFVMPIYL